jgi:hypothetical protein
MRIGVGIGVGFVAAPSGGEVEEPPAVASRTVTDSFQLLAAESHSELGVDVGAPAVDRLVVLAVSALNPTSNDGIDSVTIGGVAAVAAAEVIRSTGVGFSFCAIYWAHVPLGTVADIDLVFTGDELVADVEVYRVTGADAAAPTDDAGSGSVASGNVSDSVAIGDGSVTIAVAQLGVNIGSAGATAWTNVTEDRDGGVDIGGAFLTTSFASRADATGPGATTITAAVTGENGSAAKTLAIAVLAP